MTAGFTTRPPPVSLTSRVCGFGRTVLALHSEMPPFCGSVMERCHCTIAHYGRTTLPTRFPEVPTRRSARVWRSGSLWRLSSSRSGSEERVVKARSEGGLVDGWARVGGGAKEGEGGVVEERTRVRWGEGAVSERRERVLGRVATVSERGRTTPQGARTGWGGVEIVAEPVRAVSDSVWTVSLLSDRVRTILNRARTYADTVSTNPYTETTILAAVGANPDRVESVTDNAQRSAIQLEDYTWRVLPPKIITGGLTAERVRSEEPSSQTAQLPAYVAWVNSQLKKKPGTRTVDDLRQMKDGVALADLIEIVAFERLEGVSESPASDAEREANVEKVLHFMTSHRIRMHHTTAPDIVQGNSKSIMRLILALAAHYKPKSVKHSSSRTSSGAVSPRSHPTFIGMAHGAAAALADARRDAAVVHARPQRPRQLDHRFQDTGSDPDVRGGVDAEQGARAENADRGGAPRAVVRPRERGELEGASCGSSPRSSISGSPKLNRRLDFGVHSTRSQQFDAGCEREEEVGEACDSGEDVWGTLTEEHDHLTSDLLTTKRALLQLHELLLSGQAPDGCEDPESKPCEGTTSEEQMVVIRSQLQHTEELSRDLREELSKVRNEAMQLQGTKAGLQARLSDQEEALMNMKAELLRGGFSQQSLRTEKSDLERKVVEKDRTILDLRRELAHRDRQIEELVASLQYQQQEKEMSTRALHAQIIDLHEKLQLVGDTEVSLSHRLASQDRKMALLEGKLLHTQFDTGNTPGSRPSSGRSTQSSNTDDIQVMRDSLQSLRTSFAGNDPTHHTIDTLETSISALMDRLQMSEASRLSDSMNMSGRPLVNYDSTGDARRSPISSLQAQGMHRLDSSSGSSGGSSTKVLYFTDRAVTPFMCTIPRRLGEITLRDFRGMFDRHGNYRFHFKAMDPEFGTVKEEITHDDDVIPGWEGKIVAWIEEDHG